MCSSVRRDRVKRLASGRHRFRVTSPVARKSGRSRGPGWVSDAAAGAAADAVAASASEMMSLRMASSSGGGMRETAGAGNGLSKAGRIPIAVPDGGQRGVDPTGKRVAGLSGRHSNHLHVCRGLRLTPIVPAHHRDCQSPRRHHHCHIPDTAIRAERSPAGPLLSGFALVTRVPGKRLPLAQDPDPSASPWRLRSRCPGRRPPRGRGHPGPVRVVHAADVDPAR